VFCSYLNYSTSKGKAISDPSKHHNVLLWLIGRKEKDACLRLPAAEHLGDRLG
jgi:hypothetical protein